MIIFLIDCQKNETYCVLFSKKELHKKEPIIPSLSFSYFVTFEKTRRYRNESIFIYILTKENKVASCTKRKN